MEMVRLLIDATADMALRDNNGNTPLDLAEQSGYDEVARYLKDSAGNTPLDLAEQSGYDEVARYLKDSAATSSGQSQRFPGLATVATVENWLPIHAAVMNKRLDILDMLLKHPYPAYMWQPFLHHAGPYQFLYPFDVNARDHSNQTPLYIACSQGHLSIVERLLQLKVKASKIPEERDDPASASAAPGSEPKAIGAS
ncbi:PREDICTED: espin-like [Priapulus caudatus]|uniref:Espin-like n=1 Tax=Priapulus caudatus TaxID=37621 RepID=A0ABM1F664_PRICU|nr:PREDICTED: espin-like [Priapulus caudatus]